MTFKGTVQNGVVVLPTDVKLPEGTQVKVEPLELLPEQDPFIQAVLKVAKPQPRRGCENSLGRSPKVARASQPWALG